MTKIPDAILELKKIIANTVAELEVWTTLGEVCEALGLPIQENTGGLGKARYLHKITADASDAQILLAADRMLKSYPGNRSIPSVATCHKIQDLLWWIDDNGVQRITNVSRYRIVECFKEIPFWGRLSPRDFLEPIIPSIESRNIPQMGSDGNLYLNLESYSFANLLTGLQPDSRELVKLSVVDFFQNLGMLEWPDKRFCILVERLVSPEVQLPDKQAIFVDKINNILLQDDFKLQSVNFQSGLPVYKVQKISKGVAGNPKYIIFASHGVKPDIVIEDAVNMDIRIVRNAEQCLVYDKPPTNNDLTWKELVSWWAEKQSEDPEDSEVRRRLGLKLRNSLQSEPEKMLFDLYFKMFRSKLGDKLPALLPQVYLHYDPRSQKERHQPVLVRQRMDFLMLLRNNARIVIEIDGIQHYANSDGQAMTTRYAQMVSEDRRIRLLGYEIYRFGGAEFVSKKSAKKVVSHFFNQLFVRHGIE